MRRKKNVLGLLDLEVARLEKEGRISRRAKILATRNSMASFLAERGMTDLMPKEVDSELICSYEKWLQDNGLKPNSTAFYLRMLKAVLNGAAKEGLIKGQTHFGPAFKKVTINPVEVVQATVISREAFMVLRNLDIEECLRKAGKNPKEAVTNRMMAKIETVRDLFVFSFAAQGIEFVDLCYLRKEDVSNGCISYVRKTTSKRVTVRILPVMQEIMDRHPSDGPYLFPLLTGDTDEEVYKQYKRWQKDDNRFLKMLGQWLPGELVLLPSTARETWTAEACRNLMPLEDIAQSLGLKDDTAVTVYLKKYNFVSAEEVKRQIEERYFGG